MKDYLKKYKIELIVASYMIAIGLSFYFLAVPEVEKIASKALRIQQQEADRRLDEERASALPSMEENYSRLKESETSLNIAMDSAREVDFFKELESLAEETGNHVEFRVQENADNKAASKKKESEADIKGKLAYKSYLSMQVALEGDYAGLTKFIHKLENFHNYVNIISVSSEKKIVKEEVARASGPFSAGGQGGELPGKEIINTILEIAVYTNPAP